MSMIMRRIIFASCVVATVSAHGCADPNSAEQLTQAVDAALMELQEQKGWFHNLRTTSGYTDAMSVASCTPDADKWSYPPADEATGILARVLSTRTLKVAGVQWARGGAADYITNPDSPTGFWPDYASAIVAKMSAHYGIAITLERVYYSSSPLVIESVELGKEVDMSEPYYYLAGFHGNRPRIEALAHSCVTAGTASFFFTKKGSGITTVDQLYDVLQAGPNRNVGFIGSGNYDSVSAILPDNVSPSYDTNATDMARNVMSGAHVAGYSSEGNPPAEDGDFEVFGTGIVSPRGEQRVKSWPPGVGVGLKAEVGGRTTSTRHSPGALDHDHVCPPLLTSSHSSRTYHPLATHLPLTHAAVELFHEDMHREREREREREIHTHTHTYACIQLRSSTRTCSRPSARMRPTSDRAQISRSSSSQQWRSFWPSLLPLLSSRSVRESPSSCPC